MKILLLTKKIPYPLTDGEVIAIHNLSKGLHDQGCEIHLLALNTQKHYTSVHGQPNELAHFKTITSVDINTEVRWWPALKCLLTQKSYNLDRFHSDKFSSTLIKLLSTHAFDIVQLETLYLAQYIPVVRSHSKAKISLRSHNVESKIWENLAKQGRGLKGWYLGHCARMLARYEIGIAGSYDYLIPITVVDADYFRSQYETARIKTISVGMEIKANPNVKAPNEIKKLGVIGSMDWKPNLEGIQWFLDEVWPDMIRSNSNLEFHIAGRNIPQNISELNINGIKVVGSVDSAVEFLSTLDVVLVPLFSGSGIRVKILEAMALGKIVMSTPKGFEGIPISDGVNCFVFNDKQSLLGKLKTLTTSIDLDSIGVNAQQLVQSHFSTASLATDLLDFYRSEIET